MPENILNNSFTLSVDSLNLHLLAKCSNEMFSKLNINEVYDAILNSGLWVVKDTIRVDLLLQESNKLTLVGSKGLGLHSKQNFTLENISEGVAREVVQTGLKQIIDVTKYSASILKDVLLEKNIGTLISLPLKFMSTVIGVMNLYLTKQGQFSLIEEAVLDILAGQAAIAIRNANLYQNVISIYEIAESKTKQFITLKEIGEALSQQKSLPEILTIIAKESLNIVGHGNKVAAVMLLDKEKAMLETKAAYGELFREEYLNFRVPLSQRSIVAWVARNGKPRIAPDVTKEPDYLEISSLAKSEIAIPLLFRNEVIGVIDIESSQLNAFDEQDLELLQTLADNAAIATKIGELYDVRLKQLEALYHTGTKISSSLNLNEVLNTIAREALEAIGSQKRTLYVQLLDEKKDVLEIKVAYGVNSGDNYVGQKVTKDGGISGWVVRNQKHYFCSNVKNDPYYYYIENNPAVKSELCVPIMFGGKVIGLINVESLEENDFGQHELQLLQGLADQAGVAIENARLNEGLANTQFQLTQALEVAVIGETLAGLTHDIRTCSSLVSGEAQWIEHRFTENKLSAEEAVEAMKKIETYVERIERLTEDLTRRSQQSPTQFVMSNMADVVKESIHLMTGQALRHRIYIDVDYQSLQFPAEVDVGRLKRVFINIIMNAIDAMPDGGTLTVKATKDERDFEIEFSDTGEGISEENLDKVWDRFFTTKEDGSGLGLSICKRIIEIDHNGQITIESEKGKGTTVIIRLPVRQKNSSSTIGGGGSL